jgi:polysaccharide export outer membrane protein
VRTPQSLPYREGMKVLDAVVAAGGLVEFAAGNRATLVRTIDQATLECRVRLKSLINEGELSQNVELRPGDVVIVPEASF